VVEGDEAGELIEQVGVGQEGNEGTHELWPVHDSASIAKDTNERPKAQNAFSGICRLLFLSGVFCGGSRREESKRVGWSDISI
jgi:hypothetical protein